jgi:choline kinase
MLEVGDVSLAERALRSLRAAGIERVVAVTGHLPEQLEALGDLISERRFNPRFADAGNVYSLWCARDVVASGCYIVNSDVLFEDAIARVLVELEGSAILCSGEHGVDHESMKAVCEAGRLVRLSKQVPRSNPEYIGLTRIDPAHGHKLAQVLDELVKEGELDVYYEEAIERLAHAEPVRAHAIDGLAWIEIDDHDDLERARSEVLARVG